MHKHRNQRWWVGQRFQSGVTKHHRQHTHQHRREGDPERQKQEWRGPGLLAHSGGQNQKFAGKHAKRWHARNRHHAQHQTPADGGVDLDQTANLAHHLRASLLRGVTHGEEDGGFHQ